MINNMFLMVVSLHGKLTRAESAPAKNWDDIVKTKKKLTNIRTRREATPKASVAALKPRPEAGRAQHKHGMQHWFKKDLPDQEEIIAQQIAPVAASRLPVIAPLPSSEDSFMAFTADNELFFDPPVRERWRELGDEKTAIVPLRRAEPSYSFAGEAMFADLADLGLVELAGGTQFEAAQAL